MTPLSESGLGVFCVITVYFFIPDFTGPFLLALSPDSCSANLGADLVASISHCRSHVCRDRRAILPQDQGASILQDDDNGTLRKGLGRREGGELSVHGLGCSSQGVSWKFVRIQTDDAESKENESAPQSFTERREARELSYIDSVH